MLRQQTELLDAIRESGVFVLGDLGYQGLAKEVGIRAIIPRKKTKNETIEDRDRRHIFNKGLSSTRIKAEHAHAKMKWWRSLRDWRRPALDILVTAAKRFASTLANPIIEFASRAPMTTPPCSMHARSWRTMSRFLSRLQSSS
jgi:hypothetical protein